MTETAVKTYAVGDPPDEYNYARTGYGTWCRHPMRGADGHPTGFVCSIVSGHSGPQHVAANDRRVEAVEDIAPDPTGTRSTAEVVDGQRFELENLRESLARAETYQASLVAERDALRAQAQAARAALDNYKRKVREVALGAKRDEGWCTSGFNEAMSELGIPGLPEKIEVQVTLTATQTVKFVIDEDVADLLDDDGDIDQELVEEAIRQNYKGDLLERAESDEWELDEFEVESADATD